MTCDISRLKQSSIDIVMTVDEAETKVRIKTDEQAKNKKRKRPETQSSKTKRKKLKQLKGDNDDVKSKGTLYWSLSGAYVFEMDLLVPYLSFYLLFCFHIVKLAHI